MRFLFALILVSLVPTVGLAQDVARARTLFEEGLEAARAERWVDAREAFRESLSIAERPSTLVNLAGAEVETGHLLEGAASYRRFLELATGRRDARLRRDAERELALVEARIPHVRIAIEGSVAGDQVRLDGQTLTDAVLLEPVPLNPGSHILLVLRGREEIARRGFDVGEGETADVSLAIVAPSIEEPAPMDEVIVIPVDSGGGGGSDDGVWIGLGVGIGVVVVAAVVVGVVFATTPGAPTPYQGNFGAGVITF